MYVEKAFLVECLPAFLDGGRNEKRGNPKVNEFDESISNIPDFHVNEVLGEEGGRGVGGLALSPAGPWGLLFYPSLIVDVTH